MSLYSDLGIREGASYDEIHAAYLRLAKEAHPDKVRNEQERLAAEERMSRLNQIMDVLGRDEKRKEYDAELSRQRATADALVHEALALQALEAGRRGRWLGWGRWTAWMGIGSLAVLGIGAAFLVMSMNESDEAPAARRSWQATAAGNSGDGDLSSKSQDSNLLARLSQATARSAQAALAFVQREKPAAAPPGPANSGPVKRSTTVQTSGNALVAEARRALESPPTSANDLSPPQAAAPVPVHHEVAVVVPAGPPRPAGSISASSAAPSPAPKAEAAPSWRGLWRYTPDAGGAPIGPFTPASIEMRLQEAGGQVHGIYKAQYRDQETGHSGDVDLLLSGISSGKDWMRGIWSGNGGAHGQFELKRTGRHIVEMSWWTTKFGRRDALASGSARLVENGQ